MKSSTIRFLPFLLLFSSSILYAFEGEKAMVVTASPYATDAALEILRNGGNAVDAAVTAQWVLNVVEPQSSGIGGGGFFLFYEADTGRVYAWDGREQAPAAASPEMFLDKDLKPYPYKPDRITGGLPVGVPGTLKLMKEVHDRYGSGKYTFESLFNPAIRLAQKGVPVTKRLSGFIDGQKHRLKLFPDSKRLFLNPDENALPPGEVLFQLELADTFERIQKYGIGVFYEGEIAADIVEAVRQAPFHPGLMAKEDLFFYRVTERGPVKGNYRGYDILSMGPPSSGGTTLIEILNILESFNIKGLPLVDGAYMMLAAQQNAFEDRNKYIGDPDHVEVPVETLLSKEFSAERTEIILLNYRLEQKLRAQPAPQGGTQTSHISIVDEKGNMVSFTTTIEDVFGSAMIVPGRGFFLNNELTDFDALPLDDKGKPVANAPGPNKRPRSSMTPTFVFKEGKPVLIVGTPGGSTIIGTVANIIVNIIDHGMTLNQAMRSPKFIHRGGAAELETSLYELTPLVQGLEALGMPVVENSSFGNAQAVYFDDEAGKIIGMSDPRGEGKADGY